MDDRHTLRNGITLVAVLGLLGVSAGPCGAGWREDLTTLLRSQDEVTTDALLERIVDAAPEWQEVAAELRAISFPLPDSTGSVFIDSMRCSDGVTRPYVTYLPSGYDPARPTPLLIYLHGGVSRRELPDDPRDYADAHPFLALAEEQTWVMIFPMGQENATWWDKVGIANVHAQLRTAKQRYNIDDDRVWMTGFSDGGSGSFGFAMLHPSEFAAFVPLNGHMGVSNLAGDLPTYAGNLANTPLHVINTDLDGLYPAARMRRTIEMALTAGADIRYREYVGIGHELAYAEEELPRIAQFLERHRRDPFPAQIDWEAADPDFGLCRWLRIDRVLPAEPAAWHTDVNMVLTDDRITVGFHAGEASDDEGVRVDKLADGETLAKEMGLAAGDLIVRGGQRRIRNLEELNEFKATLHRGDHVRLTVLRDGQHVELEGDLPAVETHYLFKRERPSAALRARFRANRLSIEGSRLGGITFLVHPDMVQLDQELVIEVDGRELFREVVIPNLEFMLRNFLTHHDRRLLYLALVRIDLAE